MSEGSKKVVDVIAGPTATAIHRIGMYIILGVIGWFATQVMGHKDYHAVNDLDTAVTLAEIRADLAGIRESTSGAYKATEASRDRTDILERIESSNRESLTRHKDLKEFVAGLDSRVRELEKTVSRLP